MHTEASFYDSDAKFDALLPAAVREHSFIHWTPIEIMELTLDWLQLDSNAKVLDIGSGAGKFCVLGGMRSQAEFTGVERRSDLVAVAENIAKRFRLSNVQFLCTDIRTVNFTEYTHFYYYNPFCELLSKFDRIDDTVDYNPDAFRELEDYVIEQFELLPEGTRVVTYCSETFPFPSSYDLKDMFYDGKLALWVKVRP